MIIKYSVYALMVGLTFSLISTIKPMQEMSDAELIQFMEKLELRALLPSRTMAEFFTRSAFPDFAQSQESQAMFNKIYQKSDRSNGKVGSLIIRAAKSFSKKNKIEKASNESFAGEYLYTVVENFFLRYNEDPMFNVPVAAEDFLEKLQEAAGDHFQEKYGAVLEKYLYQREGISLKQAEMLIAVIIENLYIPNLDVPSAKIYQLYYKGKIYEFILANNPNSSLLKKNVES